MEFPIYVNILLGGFLFTLVSYGMSKTNNTFGLGIGITVLIFIFGLFWYWSLIIPLLIAFYILFVKFEIHKHLGTTTPTVKKVIKHNDKKSNSLQIFRNDKIEDWPEEYYESDEYIDGYPTYNTLLNQGLHFAENWYDTLLGTAEWQAKRKKILKRDNYKCLKCNISGVKLSVHHTYYIKGNLPWEYSDIALETLCDKCHSDAHKKEIRHLK